MWFRESGYKFRILSRIVGSFLRNYLLESYFLVEIVKLSLVEKQTIKCGKL